METETPSAAPSGGSALPVLDAGRREALTHYASQLLEGAAGLAPEVVNDAVTRLAAAEPASDAAENSESGDAGSRERPIEAYFAAVRRQALARLRQEGLTQRTAAAESDETGAALSQRVHHLTPKQREVVRLKFSHGFGYESIARITGLSVHHVGFLLHSALTNLRDTAAETDDERVTDYVLGELSDGSREAFEEALRHDRALKETTATARSLVNELRANLGRGELFTVRKTKRRSAVGWWRGVWPYATVLGLIVVGWVVWRMREPADPKARAVAADTEEFRLKPDSWKLAKARREAEASGAVAGGPGGSRTVPVKIKPPSAPAEPRTARAVDDPAPPSLSSVSSGPGGSGASSGTAAGAGESVRAANGAALEADDPDSPAVGTGKDDSSPAAAPAPGQGAGSGDRAVDPTPGGMKSKLLPAPQNAPAALGDPSAPRGPGPEKPDAVPDPTGEKPPSAVRAPPGRARSPDTPRGRPESLVQRALSPGLTARGEHATVSTPPPIPALLAEFAPEPVVPAGAPEVSATTEVAECPWAPARRLVRVVVSAAPPPQPRAAAAHVVLLIDVSSSMDAPDRLPLVGEAARRLLRELRPDDRVSVVTYAGEARVALHPTSVAQAGKIRAALSALQPQGSTNGGAGLRCAYALARERLIPDGVNRVILCTDGDFNMGVTSETELRRLVEAQARAGVALGVFGFGRGRQIDPRLEALATAGRGGSGNVNTRAEALRSMVAEVDGWQPAMVHDLRVEFQADPARIAACRLVGYEQNFLPPEAADRLGVEARELAPGASVTALFEIVPVTEHETRRRVADLGLRLHVAYRGARSTAQAIEQPVRDEGHRFSEASAGFRFTAAIAGLGLALRESPVSRERLGHVVAWAERAAADATEADPGGYREEFLALAREAREVANEGLP